MLRFVSIVASLLIDQVMGLWLAEYPQSFLSMKDETRSKCCCPNFEKQGKLEDATTQAGEAPLCTENKGLEASSTVSIASGGQCKLECQRVWTDGSVRDKERLYLKLASDKAASGTNLPQIKDEDRAVLAKQAITRAIINAKFAKNVFATVKAIDKVLNAPQTDFTKLVASLKKTSAGQSLNPEDVGYLAQQFSAKTKCVKLLDPAGPMKIWIDAVIETVGLLKTPKGVDITIETSELPDDDAYGIQLFSEKDAQGTELTYPASHPSKGSQKIEVGTKLNSFLSAPASLMRGAMGLFCVGWTAECTLDQMCAPEEES